MFRLGILCVCVLFYVLFVYRPVCHGALKLDISTLFTTVFLCTSLSFIMYLYYGTENETNIIK